jgi:hypothetical protein
MLNDAAALEDWHTVERKLQAANAVVALPKVADVRDVSVLQ